MGRDRLQAGIVKQDLLEFTFGIGVVRTATAGRSASCTQLSGRVTVSHGIQKIIKAEGRLQRGKVQPLTHDIHRVVIEQHIQHGQGIPADHSTTLGSGGFFRGETEAHTVIALTAAEKTLAQIDAGQSGVPGDISVGKLAAYIEFITLSEQTDTEAVPQPAPIINAPEQLIIGIECFLPCGSQNIRSIGGVVDVDTDAGPG